jgi:hypothetical protein
VAVVQITKMGADVDLPDELDEREDPYAPERDFGELEDEEASALTARTTRQHTPPDPQRADEARAR